MTSPAPRRAFGASGLEVYPICLGGNVFGWTADEPGSFAILDGYLEAGGNFIDTADAYPPGTEGGRSEEIIGAWMQSRGVREQIVLSTKVGQKPGRVGLRRENVDLAVEESLTRLKTSYIDVLYAHVDDEYTPLEEALSALDDLVAAGKVLRIAASNYKPGRLAQSLVIADDRGLARFQAVQTHYSLLKRAAFESGLRDLCLRENLACVPYWGLERGFLTGKYREGAPPVDSPKAPAASALLHEPRSAAILEALDRVAAMRDSSVGAVALAWLASQPAVTSVLASARNPEQLGELLAAASLELGDDAIKMLDDASVAAQADERS